MTEGHQKIVCPQCGITTAELYPSSTDGGCSRICLACLAQQDVEKRFDYALDEPIVDAVRVIDNEWDGDITTALATMVWNDAQDVISTLKHVGSDTDTDVVQSVLWLVYQLQADAAVAASWLNAELLRRSIQELKNSTESHDD